VVNTILKEADLFCPNSVRINFTIYHINELQKGLWQAQNLSSLVLKWKTNRLHKIRLAYVLRSPFTRI
ncbi:hypothetical protein RAO19_08175, partial [Pediococcus acidilactici]